MLILYYRVIPLISVHIVPSLISKNASLRVSVDIQTRDNITDTSVITLLLYSYKPDMLIFPKKNAGQRATTSFHQAIFARAAHSRHLHNSE